MDVPRRVLRIVTRRNDIRERDVLDTSERMSTCYEPDHLFLRESLTSEGCDVRLEVVLWLGNAWRVGFCGIYSAASEIHFWPTTVRIVRRMLRKSRRWSLTIVRWRL